MSTRTDVVSDVSLRGIDACRHLSDATDQWLLDLFNQALADEKKRDDIALIAVGGYGRRELAPHSDLDVVLIQRNVKNINDIASRIW